MMTMLATPEAEVDLSGFENYIFDHSNQLSTVSPTEWRGAEDRWMRDSTEDPHYLVSIPASRGAEALRPLIGSLAEAAMLTTVFIAHSDRQAQVETTPLLEESGLDYVNAYIPPGSHIGSFGLQADRFAHATEAREGNNQAYKGNVGLLVLKAVQAHGMLRLDDDIEIREIEQLRRTLRYLPHTRYNLAGFSNSGMPDRSVVHHALGLRSQPFISGQALAVHPLSVTGGRHILEPDRIHYASIYNEDWLYMYEPVKLGVATRIGRVKQLPYDPFRTGRSIGEEFGDTIAEGIYGKGAEMRDPAYWQSFIAERRRVIDIAEAAVSDDWQLDDAEKELRLAALRQSRLASAMIDAAACTEYIRLWRGDHARWHEVIEPIKSDFVYRPAATNVQNLFRRLGLPEPDFRVSARHIPD